MCFDKIWSTSRQQIMKAVCRFLMSADHTDIDHAVELIVEACPRSEQRLAAAATLRQVEERLRAYH